MSDMAAYMRHLRAERRENHLCTRCAAQDEKTLSGSSLCASCAKKNAEKRQKVRAYRRENRLCVRCGGQDALTEAGQYYCAECAQKNKEKDARREMRRRASHACVQCGAQDERTAAGMACCAKCAEKINQDQKRRRDTSPEKRAKDNAEKNATYYYMKRHHLCVECGSQDALTLAGRAYCHDCAEKHNASKRRRVEENREEYNRRARERRAAAIEAGKCVSCGRPTEDGHAQCRRCLAYRRDHYAANRSADINWPRGGNGICYSCNKTPALPGRRLCQSCYDRQLESLSHTYNGQGPTAPRPDDHPFKVAARLNHEARLYRERKGGK